ncbi:MAG: VaFE repeat-containing surface-anchored protein, partial [Lachnospiraceae bacterium]|nr:VaFE repeat-containing surface-anchored protein [Lachnospiraceae bacterium]
MMKTKTGRIGKLIAILLMVIVAVSLLTVSALAAEGETGAKTYYFREIAKSDYPGIECPNLTVDVYKADNQGKPTGEPLYTFELTANGEAVGVEMALEHMVLYVARAREYPIPEGFTSGVAVSGTFTAGLFRPGIGTEYDETTLTVSFYRDMSNVDVSIWIDTRFFAADGTFLARSYLDTAFEVIDNATGNPLSFVYIERGYWGYSTDAGASTRIIQEAKGGTVRLYDVPDGNYTIREIVPHGYVVTYIEDRGGNGGRYSADSCFSNVVVGRVNSGWYKAQLTFDNQSMGDKSIIALRKTAEGAQNYPAPTVSIYKAENGQPVGEPIWTRKVTANGESIYPDVLLEPGARYYIQETGQDITGYDCTGTVNGNEGMLFTAGAAGETLAVTIDNVYTPSTAAGSLVIEKQFNGNLPQGVSSFAFEIVDTATGAKLSFLPSAEDSYVFSPDGGETTQVFVPANGRTVVTGLPAGTYVIREILKQGIIGYVISDVTGDGSETYTLDYAVQEIGANDEVTVTFTNRQVGTVSAKMAIRLRKEANGLVDGQKYPDPLIRIYEANVGTSGHKEEILWEGILPANGEFVYPTVYFQPNTTYYIEEIEHDIVGYYCESKVNGNSAMKFKSSVSGSLQDVIIRNAYTPPGGVYVQKRVVGSEENQTQYFSFRVTLKDKNGNPVTGTFGGLNFKNGEASLALKHGQSYYIWGLPEGYTISVTEEFTDGYIVLVNGGRVAENRYTCTIGDQIESVEFRNIFPEPTVVDFSFGKTLDGQAPGRNDFSFVLQRKNDSTEKMVVQNQGGTVTFKGLTFSSEGTYSYILYEQSGSDDSIEYDTTLYEIYISVSVNDGRLEARAYWRAYGTDDWHLFLSQVDGPVVEPTCVFKNYTKPIAEIGTSAYDSKDGDKTIAADRDAKVKDVIAYTNLIPGETYTVSGQLMRKSDGSTLEVNGKPVTATKTFTAPAAEGIVEITFEFDASSLAGEELVAFEVIYLDGEEVAIHADINDEGQTVEVYEHAEIGTTATDSETNDHFALADKQVTINDAVFYQGLIPGKTYTVSGQLMRKSDGSVVEGATAETMFVASASGSGTVTVSFTFDASSLAGDAVVAFETLMLDGVEVVTDADINNENQTVYFPAISTEAKDRKDNDKIVAAAKDVTVVDVVKYTNLIPGKEYTVKGSLHVLNSDGSDGGALAIDYNSKTFTPEYANGIVEVEFKFDATSLAGKTLVAFETVYLNGKEVAPHADINDKDQTVTVETSTTPDPEDPPEEPKTGDLTIRKTVNAGDKNQFFTFTVTFVDDDGTYSYTGSKEGTIKSGDTIQLKHDESITISGLPVGTSYTVVESNNAGYTVAANCNPTDTVTGKIEDGKTATAAFTNTKNTTPPPDEPGDEPSTGALTVSKAVAGEGADPDKAFSFTVTLSDTKINGTYGGMT